MSREIDEKIVSMQFDNAKFEKNVATTMSTLDKFKQKLKFDGAARGLQEIEKASGNVRMSGLGSSVDAVKAKFSALDVVAVTTLANITNSAVDAGKRFLKSLTVEPVSDGFKEYELTLNSVQTTMAGTGKTAEEVEQQLKKLDEYADKTIYSSADMFNNLPKFTNAGVDLEVATKAMIGIANATALAGGDANKASIAFYNLGQSIGTGYLTRMDYNSINNAGIATMEWKNAMIEAAIAQGTLTKTGEDAYQAGGKTFTLQQLFIDGLQHQWATADVLIDVFGDYGDANTEIGKKAWSAAQDVKTMTMMMESLKATAGTGWKDTWQIVFGGLDEAKEFWTGLNNVISDVVTSTADFRNRVLETALAFSQPWKNITDKLDGLEKITEITSNVKGATKTLEYFQNVVDRVWMGDYNNNGDNPDRRDLLRAAGYDPRVVQELVNLGEEGWHAGKGYALSVEEIRAAHEKFGLTLETTEEEMVELVKEYNNYSDVQLRSAGLTSDEIQLYKALQKEAQRTGRSIDDLANEMSEQDGRSLLIDSFHNIIDVVLDSAKAAKKAWKEIFGLPTASELAIKLYNAAKAIKKFTDGLRLAGKNTGIFTTKGDKLVRTLKGVFSILHLIYTVMSGGYRLVLKIVSKLLNELDIDILDVTASIGDALVAFHDWVLEGGIFGKTIEWIADKIPGMVEWIKVLHERLKEGGGKLKEWADLYLPKFIGRLKSFYAKFKEFPSVKTFLDSIRGIIDAIKGLTKGDIDSNEFAKQLGENLGKALKSLPMIAVDVGKNFMLGFKQGLGFDTKKIIDDILSFCSNFVSAFASGLGVHSPSIIAFAIAGFFITGFVNGLVQNSGDVYAAFNSVSDNILKIVRSFWASLTDEAGNIKWGNIFAVGILITLVAALKKLANGFSAIGDGIGSVSDILVNAADTVKNFNKILSAVAWDLKAQAFQKFAIGIAVLAAAIWALAQIEDPNRLWNAVGVIAVLATVTIGLAWAMGKLSDSAVEVDAKAKTLKKSGMQKSIMQIGLTILALSYAVKMLGELPENTVNQGFAALTAMASGLLIFIMITALVTKKGKEVGEVGKMISKIAGAMLIMALVMKIVGGMDPAVIITGLAVMEGFVLMIVQMGIACRIAGIFAEDFGKNVLKIALSLGVMAGVMKIIGSMSMDDVQKGLLAMEGFVLIMAQLALVNRLANGKNGASTGNAGNIGYMLMVVAGLATILALLDGVHAEASIGSAVAISILLTTFSGCMVILSTIKEDLKVSIQSLGSMLAVTAGLAAILGLLGGLHAEASIGSAVAIGILLNLMATAMLILSKADRDIQVGLGSMMSMTLVAIAMGGILGILGGLHVEASIGSALAIGLLMNLMATAMVIAGNASSSADAGAKTMLKLVPTMAGIAVVLGYMAKMDVNASLGNAYAIGILLNLMSTAMVIASYSSDNVKKAAGSMLVMAGVVAVVGVVLGLLAVMNASASLNTAIALGILLNAMAVACLICSVIPVAGAIQGAVALAGFVSIMGVVIAAFGALAQIPGFTKIMNDGAEVFIIIGEAIGGFVGGLLGGIIGGVGEAFISLIPKLGEALGEFGDKIKPFIATVSGLSGEEIAKVGILTAIIGALAITAFLEGIVSLKGLGLVGLGIDLLLFGGCVKAFNEIIKGVDKDSVDAASTVTSIVLALTEADLLERLKVWPFGGLDFDDLKEDLISFGNIVVEFSNSISGKINTRAIEAVTNAGKIIIELQKALPRSGGLIQDIFGEQDFEAFAIGCKTFLTAIIEVNDQISKDGYEIQNEKLEKIKDAGMKFTELADAIPKSNGLVQKWAGETDLGKFGEALNTFCTKLLEINEKIAPIEYVIQNEKLEQITTAGSHFTELASAIPKHDGFVQTWAGHQDLKKFGTAVEDFVKSMLDVNTKLKDHEVDIDLKKIEDITAGGQKLNDLATVLPKEGGLWQKVTGENNLSNFGTAIENYAEALEVFSDTAVNIKEDRMNVAIDITEDIKDLMTDLVDWNYANLNSLTENAIPAVAAAIAGFSENVQDVDVERIKAAATVARDITWTVDHLQHVDWSAASKFNLYNIGAQLRNYSNALVNIKTEPMREAVYIANSLNSFVSVLNDTDYTDLENFNVTPVAKGLNDFYTNLGEIDYSNLDHAINASNRLINIVRSLKDVNADDASGLVGSIQAIVTLNMEEFINSFASLGDNIEFMGMGIGNKMIDGYSETSYLLGKAGAESISTMIDAVSLRFEELKKLGGDLVHQIAEGISGSTEVLTAIENLIDTTTNGGINGGKWLGEGLVNGIEAMGTAVSGAGKDMGTAAVNSTRAAVSGIMQKIDDELDTRPTIKPVLDLSDVKTGVQAIDGMFSMKQSIGVDSNVRAISLSMAGGRQNGNDDVVSAINKLGKGLGDIRGDTYNFGDFTYSGDEEVERAVKVLVRAAKLGGRA